jgi:hypothetical protein
MSLNSQQLQECRELVRFETQLFLDELYDLKRLVRTMDALAKLVMVGVIVCVGALTLAVFFLFWTLAVR